MFWREFLAELGSRIVTPEKLAAGFSRLVDIILIVVGAILLYLLARAITRRVLGKAHARRAATYISIVHSIVGYVIFFLALVLILRALGVDYTAILAGAGVAGLAVGFGAQTLIRDFISGVFLLLEDLISVGDVVTVGEVAGVVEVVGLRITKVRAFDGALYVVPNGELTRFGNKNRGYMRAIVTLDLAYEQDAEKGMAVAREAAAKWYAENADKAIEPPAVTGLLDFGESGVKIRVTVKVNPGQQWEAEQQLRLRIKQAFDASGTEIPFPRRVVILQPGPPPPSIK